MPQNVRPRPLLAGPVRTALASMALASAALATPAAAQVPGVPIAQSAFVRPGFSAALNGGASVGGPDSPRAGLLAVAFGGGGGQWQVTAGGGLYQVDTPGFRRNALAYGGRAAFRVLDRGALGATAFAGFGAARLRFDEPGDDDPAATREQIPVGVSVGYRGAWGTTGSGRGWGVSVAPAVVWSALRLQGADAITSRAVRGTATLEVALNRRFGVAVAYEDGQRARVEEAGSRGGVLGVAIAIAR